MDARENALQPLRELNDLEVADGDPDVRGWSVRTADGSAIGTVDELLVDRDSMHVRYLGVSRAGDAGDEPGERPRFLVPVSSVRLTEGDEVHLPITAAEAATSPAWTGAEEPATHEADVTLLYAGEHAGRVRIRAAERRV